MSKVTKAEFSLTDWFPENVKPVRVGVYETELSGYKGYSDWDGCAWGFQYISADRASDGNSFGSQNKRWRGLTARGGK